MPGLDLNIEGNGGYFSDVFRRNYRQLQLPAEVPLRVETLDRGMASGAPSIAFIVELPRERTVIVAQTSLKLFQLAAAATVGKYGDVTGNAVLGHFAKGAAHLTFSTAIPCPACEREIPGSCKFCPECGHKLAASEGPGK